jgi:hypothetical protein
MSNIDTSNNQAIMTLPGLKEIFEALRQGRHLCQADGRLYQQLDDHQETYTHLFDQLGFELRKHKRDFYYFYAPNATTDKSQRIAVFMFILIQHITDQGHPIEETLMNQQFNYNELPHLGSARYQEIMAQLGIVDTDDLATIVTGMARMGFVDRINDQTFAFRPPVYRFLDICQDIARYQTQTKPAAEESEE